MYAPAAQRRRAAARCVAGRRGAAGRGVARDGLGRAEPSGGRQGRDPGADRRRKRGPHWRRNNFATWLFRPAATGWYPSKGRLQVRPVPVLGEPWPGIPVRGRNAAGRADACWVSIAPGLTPHGLRHTHRTLMEELRIPPKLMDERMGHQDGGSVQARYTHITTEMRRQLVDGLTGLWETAIVARKAMSPRSPVAVLDRLLNAKRR